MSTKTVTPLVSIEADRMQDDVVSKLCDIMQCSVEEAERMVAAAEKQLAYRKDYNNRDYVKAKRADYNQRQDVKERRREYRKQRYEQLKLVASVLRSK